VLGWLSAQSLGQGRVEIASSDAGPCHFHMTMSWKLILQSPMAWGDQLSELLNNETMYACPHLKTYHPEPGQAVMRYKEGKRGRIRTVSCSKRSTAVRHDLGTRASVKKEIEKSANFFHFGKEGAWDQL